MRWPVGPSEIFAWASDEREPDGLSDDREADDEPECNEDAHTGLGVGHRVKDRTEECDAEHDTGGETEPRQGPCDEPDAIPDDSREQDGPDDDEVDPVHGSVLGFEQIAVGLHIHTSIGPRARSLEVIPLDESGDGQKAGVRDHPVVGSH